MARFDSDGLTILFEGVPLNLPAGQTGGAAVGTLRVAGPGRHSFNPSVLGKALNCSYQSGVATITLDTYTVTLTEGGRKARVGDQGFDLANAKKTIAVRKDGTATLR